MRTELFIARKILSGRKNENRLSRPIVLIALTSIIIGVAVMIISVSIVKGFQGGIRDKVIGFGSHIQITKHLRTASMESIPIEANQEFYPSLEDEEGVKNIQVFAYKPALLQSATDSVVFDVDGVEQADSRQDIMGVLFKGIDADYDWSFFDDKMIDGELISFDSSNNEVMISQYISNKLGYKVGDKLNAYFIVNNKPKKRPFVVKGIYRTGFEEFDKQYIFTQIQHLQKVNKWGVQTLLTIADTCINDQFVIRGITFGGMQNDQYVYYKYKYDWGNGYTEQNVQLVSGLKDTNIVVASSDFELSLTGSDDNIISIPDTAYANIHIETPCKCSESAILNGPFEIVSDSEILMPFGKIEVKNGKGTHDQYVGGFEVILEDWDDLESMDDRIYGEKIPNTMKTETIIDRHPEIFAWLDFLDLNIIIILSLILVVSLINMVTSLLVIILEKTNMIGVLKALGATDSNIRKIFTYNSMFLLSRGLLWGNIIGLGLIALQHYTGFLKLNPDAYYLDYVPVDFNIWNILLINLLTIVVCRLTLVLPSFLVTKIKPIKAIRFD